MVFCQMVLRLLNVIFVFQSRNHDWRIHRDPVWEEQFADRTPDSNNGNVSDEGEHKEHIEEERRVSMEEGVQRACSRVGEVYNPFDVNTNVRYFSILSKHAPAHSRVCVRARGMANYGTV